jgi:alpha-D-ribose 1-methylphosphonate 5-phosphate C-P lyase
MIRVNYRPIGAIHWERLEVQQVLVDIHRLYDFPTLQQAYDAAYDVCSVNDDYEAEVIIDDRCVAHYESSEERIHSEKCYDPQTTNRLCRVPAA